VAATPIYSPRFNEQVKKYSSLKRELARKINLILRSPIGYGEPLKYNLAGLSSSKVSKRFVVIYAYCKECRAKGMEGVNNCDDCTTTPDESVRLFAFGPHDDIYRLMNK
jgi:hypothetical protein